MSTLAYAALTTMGEETARRRARGDEVPDGIPKYIGVMVSLVPAEVLALHATILSFTTETTNNTVKITEPQTLTWAFYGLVFLSIVLFALPRILSGWKRWDWLRTALAPLAFVTWAALQKATAFDAAWSSLDQAPRTAGALGVAALPAIVSAALPRETQNKPPEHPRRGHDDSLSRMLFYCEEREVLYGEVEERSAHSDRARGIEWGAASADAGGGHDGE